MPLTYSESIKQFIKQYETLHDGDLSIIGLEPKLDGAGIWTEGWGKAMRRNGKFMTVKDYPTLNSILPYRTIKNEAQAELELVKKLNEISHGVRKRLKVPVTQNQFDALVSHAYNCGYSQTLYTLINSRAKESSIKKWFTTKYISSGGVKLRGLQYRRNDEYEIWLGINYKREYNISI